MTASTFARQGLFARLFAMFLALGVLAGCGSGAVSGSSTTSNGGPLSVSPPSGTLYTDIPFTFVVTGGTGTYLIASSDQLVLPVAGTLDGNIFTVTAGPVIADTPVTLNIRDSGSATPVSVSLTVKPRTISNTVTIIPSASQSAACGSAVCAGGDAEVRVVLTQGGLPLVNREVRFDVVSGDYRIITSAPGSPEALSLSGTTFTDESGTARMRVRVLGDALSQTALLQATDIASGFSQRTSFTIAPSSNAPLNARPSTIVFQGAFAVGVCASGISADVIVFGGRPPYLISQPGSFSVSPTVITQSGGRFTVTATGQCSDGSEIAVVDSNGATVTVTASNELSGLILTPPDPPFVVTPTTVTLSSCNSVGNVALNGGTGTYFGASGDDSVTVVLSGALASIRRTPGYLSPITTPVTVTLTDGQTTKTVRVILTGTALTNPC